MARIKRRAETRERKAAEATKREAKSQQKKLEEGAGAMLGVIGGLLSGIGSLFGNSSSQKQTTEEEFEKDSTSTTDASAQDLSPELLKSLEGVFQSILGSGRMEGGTEAVAGRLKQLTAEGGKPQFDVESFARGVTQQATANAGMDLESGINDILTAVGSSSSGNSMASLLTNKMQNNTVANLAGVQSNATATGEQIRIAQQNAITEGINALGTTLSNQILGVVGATRGATQTGTSTTKEHTKGKATTNSTGSSNSRGNPFSALGSVFGSFGGASANA